ncbi:MAG: M15 family metallopeptidase [Patescibacteria group bacterium]|nr:M15 family metallopeptidase [Patescibacteria group bacterium]
MFENWKIFEGTYVNPIVLKDRMTTIEEVRQSSKDKNKEVNEAILERLKIIEVKYLSKDKKVYLGQIVIDKDLADNILKLFDYIEKMNNNTDTADDKKFFIEKIIPISNEKYKDNDALSMEDNNTSAFNYRLIEGKNRLSSHAFGFSIDINPKDNPVMINGVVSQPRNGKYDEKNSNTLTPHHKVVEFLKQRGFEWGGDWKSSKDYHHFQKILPTKEYLKNYIDNAIDNTEENILDTLGKLFINSYKLEHFQALLNFVKNDVIISKIGKEQYLKFFNLLNEQIHNAQIRS